MSEDYDVCDDHEPAYCDVCGGEGIVDCQEYHCDWVNYGEGEWEICPECRGSGMA